MCWGWGVWGCSSLGVVTFSVCSLLHCRRILHCVSHWESPGDTSRNLHFASKGKPGFVCMSAPLGFCFQNSLHSLLSQPHHRLISHLFFFLKKSFIHFRLKFFFISLLAAVGLWCCTQALSSWGEQGLLCVMGLLIVVASLVAGHRL